MATEMTSSRESTELAAVSRLAGLRQGAAAWVGKWMVECGVPRCRRFHVSHRLLVRMPGMSLNGQWYCSPACLSDALGERLVREAAAERTSGRRHPRMPYRLILLSRGLVSEEQIEQARLAREAAAARGESLDWGEALVSLGHVSEEHLAAARASEAGCGVATDAFGPLDGRFAWPALLSKRFQAVPVQYAARTGRLWIGFVQRIEPRLLQAAAQVTGCASVEPCFLTASRFKEQVARLRAAQQKWLRSGSVRPALGGDGGLLVEALLRESMRVDADELRLARIKDLLWVRLSSRQKSVDHLVDVDMGESLGGMAKSGAENRALQALEPRLEKRTEARLRPIHPLKIRKSLAH